ncbi:vitamin B12 dependent methionine synthase, activation domain protein [Lachnospiraceae bacterium YH-ros2226]
MIPIVDDRIRSVWLTREDRSEVLRYLGYRGQTIGPELDTLFSEAINKVNRAAAPRLIYCRYQRKADESLPDDLYFLTGRDITEHLKGCQEILLIAATLGSGLDRAIHVEEVRDTTSALIMDSAGSTLIEAVLDSYEAMLRKDLGKRGLYLTSRFSPGYGDLPLASQNPFGQALEVHRIGLTMTAEHIMVPRKSVTAVLGIATRPLHEKKKSCASCNLNASCRFRKASVVCGE